MNKRHSRPDAQLPHKVSMAESRICIAKLMEAVQKARYHGDIRIKLKDGELIHIECSQSCLPRDILEDRFICVLLRRVSDAVYSEDENEGAREAHQKTGSD